MILDPIQFQLCGAERIFDPKYFSSNYLLIPMDARTTASPTGNKDYVFYGMGGISWTAPYLAGVYALACQIDPKITPEKFWSHRLTDRQDDPGQA